MRVSAGIRAWRAKLRALFLRVAPRTFLAWATPSTSELGLLGELLAARHLRRLGWRVQAHRLKTPWGEIDLVLWRGGSLACVEVKSGRRGPRFRPLDRVRPRTRTRLLAAARGLAQVDASDRQRATCFLVEVDTSSPRKPRIEVHPLPPRAEGGGIRYVSADDPRFAP